MPYKATRDIRGVLGLRQESKLTGRRLGSESAGHPPLRGVISLRPREFHNYLQAEPRAGPTARENRLLKMGHAATGFASAPRARQIDTPTSFCIVLPRKSAAHEAGRKPRRPPMERPIEPARGWAVTPRFEMMLRQPFVLAWQG